MSRIVDRLSLVYDARSGVVDALGDAALRRGRVRCAALDERRTAAGLN